MHGAGPMVRPRTYLWEKEIDDRDQGQMLDGFFIPFP